MPSNDLGAITAREQLYPLYKAAHPQDTSNIVIGIQVGQIARFLLEMKAGDYVITPAADTEWLHYGKLEGDPSYHFVTGSDGCPYPPPSAGDSIVSAQPRTLIGPETGIKTIAAVHTQCRLWVQAV
jgi:hypothetical protein